MRRRDFIAGLGGAATWPLAARAQQDNRVRRVGALSAGSLDETLMAGAFREEMTKLGWVEGHNLRIDQRFAAGDAERVRIYAAEIVRSNPDAIVVAFGAAMRAVQAETRTIPIVMAGAGDVITNGTLKNLAHPETNITGFINLFGSLGGKWLELLKEAVPKVEKVGFITRPTVNSPLNAYFASIEEAARVFNVKAIRIDYDTVVDLVRAIDAFAAEPNGGLILTPSIGAAPQDVRAIVQLADQHRLPTVSATRDFTVDGVMLAYGADIKDLWRGAATYVDRILRGAKVSELPVEYPTSRPIQSD